MLADLEYELIRIAAGVRADWAISVTFVTSDEEIAIDADRRVETMSVMKIPLLVTLFRACEANQVQLDQRIVIDSERKRFGTGVLRTLDDGLTLSLRDAATLMIIQSDNTATDICFEAVGGPDAVTTTMRQLGLQSIEAAGTTFDWFQALAASMEPALAQLSPGELFRHGYPDLSPRELAAAREAFHFGERRSFGLATAREIGKLLMMIDAASCASRASCDEMLRILRLQQMNTRIPRYIFGAAIAHKTGDFDPFIANDVGIIEPFGQPPIIACFFASHHRGIWANLEDAIARMAAKIYDYARTREVHP
jgi:beta-lactamase class A